MIECSTWQSWLPWWWPCGPEDLWLTAFSLLDFIVAKGEKCASGRALPLGPCCYLRSCQGGGRHRQGPVALLKSISPHERMGNLFYEITICNKPRKIWFCNIEMMMWLVRPSSWGVINTLFSMIKSKPMCTTWLLGHVLAVAIIVKWKKKNVFWSVFWPLWFSSCESYIFKTLLSVQRRCVDNLKGRFHAWLLRLSVLRASKSYLPAVWLYVVWGKETGTVVGLEWGAAVRTCLRGLLTPFCAVTLAVGGCTRDCNPKYIYIPVTELKVQIEVRNGSPWLVIKCNNCNDTL